MPIVTKERWLNVGLGLLAVVTILTVWLAFDKQQRATVATTAVASTPQASSSSTSSKPRAVFLGDSYAAGVGGEGTKWTTLVSEHFGWQEVNLSHGGTGYVTSLTGTQARQACFKDSCPSYGELVPDVVKAKPEVVVISGGRNDGNKDVSKAAEELFTDLRTELPKAEIYVLTPIWDDAYAPPGIFTKASAVKTAADKAGITAVDIGHPLTGKANLISKDGVNPNAAGYKVLADVTVQKVSAVKPE